MTTQIINITDKGAVYKTAPNKKYSVVCTAKKLLKFAFKYALNVHTERASTGTIYITFTYVGVTYRIRISDHSERINGLLNLNDNNLNVVSNNVYFQVLNNDTRQRLYNYFNI